MNNSTVRYVLIGLLLVAGVYLAIDHGQHIAPYIPFVFLLGCLFMHLFMHGGHTNSHGDDNDSK